MVMKGRIVWSRIKTPTELLLPTDVRTLGFEANIQERILETSFVQKGGFIKVL